MKYNLLALALIFTSSLVLSQNNISIGLGPSFHGSGDLPGYCFQAGLALKTNQIISYDISIKNTTNGRELELYFIDPQTGILANSSYRLVTSGTQLELCPRFTILRNRKINFPISIGGLVRYNVSNDVNQIAFLYPAVTGYPIPLIAIDVDNVPFKYFSFGYIVKLGLSFKLSTRSQLAIALNMQNDNHGNLVWNLPISYGYTIH